MPLPLLAVSSPTVPLIDVIVRVSQVFPMFHVEQSGASCYAVLMDVEIALPQLHADQMRVWRAKGRFNAVRCGRRWGKTIMLAVIAARSALRGQQVGIFVPEYSQWAEIYSLLLKILADVISEKSRTSKHIVLKTGGKIDFWQLTDNILAGRGRTYHVVLIDEAAFTKSPQMIDEIWPKAIKPTLWTTGGSVWVFSTPLGKSADNFFYSVCNSPDFVEHYAPTSGNPYISAADMEKEKAITDPLVWRQEFDGEFVDWSRLAFFDMSKCLIDGQPIPYPAHCEYVFATLDTAVKTGKTHDGTALCLWSWDNLENHRLTLLDWDVLQIEGALLEEWLPTVFQRLEALAVECGARRGSAGCWIEDKSSGMVLIQQAARRGWPAHAIDSKLTAMGKDERAISVSGYVYRGMMKLSDVAYNKTSVFKGKSQNHFTHQFFEYRIGVKNQIDDALDAGCYGIIIACGNNEGY